MNKKILKEWEKIKNYAIFKNIDEFAKLFEEKPNGSCYKKYTSYDWCKENFFFGTYQDLLNFYKLNKEVPFYLKHYLGKKFGQLTIKKIIVEVVDNKRKYFAICKCDCGRECKKEISRILERSIKTCGMHKQSPKKDLLSNYPEIIDQYWDYDKNIALPQNVYINSNEEFWWKDETGSFKLKPVELSKRKFGTSFHEQAIFYYCNKLFNNIKNRYRTVINNINTEIDVFFPDLNLGIEYDGYFWHKDKESADIEKTKRINSKNIYLIRVREKGLREISNTMTRTLFCDYGDFGFETTINSIFLLIKDLYKNKLTDSDKINLEKFKLTEDEFDCDKIKILNQYRTNYITNNLTKTCLIKYWDYDKNKDIIPQKLSIDDDVKVWFRCDYGFSKKINIKSLAKAHRVECDTPTGCHICKSFYCPFVNYCGFEHVYYKDNFCLKIKQYYYDRILKDSNSKREINVYADETREKQIYELPAFNEEESYDPFNLYKLHREDFVNNSPIASKLKLKFPTCILGMQNFINFTEFKEFLEIYKPTIKGIRYEEFDVDEEHRNLILDIIDRVWLRPHKWEDYKEKLSEEFFGTIKNKLCKRYLSLDTSVFDWRELKVILKKYRPEITGINFLAFDGDEEQRFFILDQVKRNNLKGQFEFDLEYQKLSVGLLKKIPEYICYNDNFMDEKWHAKYFNLYGDRINAKREQLNKHNFGVYVHSLLKQRKNANHFAYEFNVSSSNFFVNIKTIKIKMKEAIHLQLFGLKRNNNEITIKLPSLRFQNNFYVNGKLPHFSESPFEITDVNGYVIVY